MEVDWTERLRLAVFRKYDEKAVEANDEPQSVSGLPASHEIEPFERWCLARDAQWVEADTFYDRKHLKTPTPDLTYAFPILNSPFTGFAAQETLGTIFSLDVLRDLRNDANIKLISSPTCGLKNDDNGSPKSDLNKTNLMCFPWAIVEIKHPRVNKTDIEYCYCQAANDSAIALRMLGALFRKATGCLPADLPPIVAITCIGPELRVWLTYNAGTGGGREDDMNISMRCVYATHLELVWGVHSSRLIIKHMHVWASRILKPRICMYLSLLASRRSLSNQTLTTPSARSSSDTEEDSGAYSSSEESSILPDGSPSERKFKSLFINKCAPDFVAPDISSTPSPSRVYALKRTTTSTTKKSNKNFTTPSPPQGSASKMSTSSNAKGSNKKSIPDPRTPQSQTHFEVRRGTPSFTPILKLREETLGASRSQQTPLKSEKEPVPNFESIGSLEVDALVIELEDLVANFQKLGVSASSTPIQETRRSSYFYIRCKALAAISRPPSGRGDETSPRREFPVGKRFGVEDDKQQFWNWTLGASDYDHSADVALTLTLASIVLLEYGGKLAMAIHEVYDSPRGATMKNLEIEKIQLDLRDISRGFCSIQPSKCATEDDLALCDLGAECHSLALELLDVLDSLKVPEGVVLRPWVALRKTVRSAVKARRIEGLEERLHKLKSQLAVRMLGALRNEQSSLSCQMRQYKQCAERWQRDNIACFNSAEASLQSALECFRKETKALQTSVRNDQKYQSQGLSALEVSLTDLTRQVTAMQTLTATVSRNDCVLRNLTFPEMAARYKGIPQAYKTTYSWIFEDNGIFQRWLTMSDKTFWIGGKAGSGKSTFMKFLANHPTTKSGLQQWSEGRRLVIADHYMWNPGAPMQKSKEGLLRNLLFQILRQCPDLIETAFPSRSSFSDFVNRHADSWTESELAGALDLVLNHQAQITSFCFFLDGLDEYSDPTLELIRYLESLSTRPHVKLCVSSRPWNEFHQAYGQIADHHLTLQHLTRTDIKNYIVGELINDPLFINLAPGAEYTDSITKKILNRAQGVFLWVRLVVRDLRQALAEGDDTKQLDLRLEALPSDLESYFGRMLYSLNPVRRRQAARALLVMLHASGPLKAAVLCYLDEELESYSNVATSRLRIDKQTMLRRINQWGRDFVQITVAPSWGGSGPFSTALAYDAGFMHRTMNDFLMEKGMQDELWKLSGSDFDPRTTLCRIHICLAGALDPSKCEYDISKSSKAFLDIAGEVMRFAKECELHKGATPFEILDILDRIGEHHLATYADGLNRDHWTTGCLSYFRPYHDGRLHDITYQSSFLAYAANFGLNIYLEAKLSCSRLSQDKLSLILDATLRNKYLHAPMATRWIPNGRMVEMLLEYGAKPTYVITNSNYDGVPQTIWSAFIEDLWRLSKEPLAASGEFAHMIKMLLRAGVGSFGVTRDDSVSVFNHFASCCHPDEWAELREALEKAYSRTDGISHARHFQALTTRLQNAVTSTSLYKEFIPGKCWKWIGTVLILVVLALVWFWQR
ncbi:hypothetical protein KC332_g3577 [Hortaea werneckii]|uniref:NACHT domain-containing protein n=1 Tax=Hortaea werneckii EXF-2000 TaxID=1157616 RepID=A0A1Z5SRD7_HORWE|nr:hypothetical protein KC358_g3879 [Hortaea werneckii]OTA23399.1 hypothetical protein BTJ68_13804 [Hortaea werneckii EXF-2000]KAI6848251.1 hypothetical protein KC350_g3095 [Hortaea werneckii]KAI6940623.1 hypothetical protein KC341_g3405 [Hortaea werneckii]KAI6948800.1 hypothetical protein KC348_g1755 [Hortaea werneckii]